MPVTNHTSYFREAFAPTLRPLITRVRDLTGDLEYDTIVGTGMSGALVVPTIARALKKDWVIVRKENDDTHDWGHRAIGTLGERWLFVDDFIDSGRTLRRVYRDIQALAHYHAADTELVGVVEYKSNYRVLHDMQSSKIQRALRDLDDLDD